MKLEGQLLLQLAFLYGWGIFCEEFLLYNSGFCELLPFGCEFLLVGSGLPPFQGEFSSIALELLPFP